MKELKYCKFCDKEKPVKDFCKSGGAIKNICRECQNKKQKQIYNDSKKTKQLQQENQKYKEVIDKAIEYINDNLIISSILDGKKDYTINDYSFDYRKLLDILKEVKTC